MESKDPDLFEDILFYVLSFFFFNVKIEMDTGKTKQTKNSASHKHCPICQVILPGHW